MYLLVQAKFHMLAEKKHLLKRCFFFLYKNKEYGKNGCISNGNFTTTLEVIT